jgi:hypothetical protein
LKSLRFSSWVRFVNLRSPREADPRGSTSSQTPHPRIGIATLFRLGSFCHFASIGSFGF